jgi:proline dehydrogenase
MLKARLRRLARLPLHLALQAAGRVYVPGQQLGDALSIAHKLSDSGIATTLGYFHGMHDSPERIAGISRDIIQAVAELQPRGYLSIKAPALNYDMALIGGLLQATSERGLLAHFDSHEHYTAEQTLACVRQAASLGSPVGLTIPGRWQRSPDDADEVSELGVRVRVVKGEWGDPTAPHLDPRQGYLNVVDRLAGKARQVAIATHDPWLARESLSRLQAAGTDCELELLNGLPRREMLALAREFKVAVRVYIPFGIAWRPYALSKAAQNPRIVWWVLRDACQGVLAKAFRP